MNYMKELNAFREWLLMNQLPTSAVALWYSLMSLNNLARWKRMFNAPNSVVQQLTGLSKQGVIDARNVLIDHELIHCIKGRRGRAPIYQMHSLVKRHEHKVDELLDSTLDPSEDKHLTVLRHTQDKTKKNVHPFVKNNVKSQAKSQAKNNSDLFNNRSKKDSLFDELRKEAGL